MGHTHHRLLAAAGLLAVLVAAAAPPATAAGTPLAPIRHSVATGPLRVSPVNPRYFTDTSTGQVAYLTGSHTWLNFVDGGYSDPPPAFDWSGWLDFIEGQNHNFFRLWVWEQTKWGPFTPNAVWFAPHPYPRTGPGTALDGKPKFDLSQFNEAYFQRMRARIIEARDRGFYVSVMLFDGWSNDDKDYGGGNPWLGHPFHRDNNINGIDGDPFNTGEGKRTHTLDDPVITALQDAYVRKVIDTVNDLDNVLYEISNESHTASELWQYHMIDLIHAYEAGKPKQHPVGMTVEFQGGENSDLVASNAEWISPNAGSSDRNNPPAEDGDKVVLLDTDHYWGTGGDGTWIWKGFLRGYNPIFMDPHHEPGYNFSDPNWISARRAMGQTLTYSHRVRLATMTPQNALASTSYCLARPAATDAEYLVLAPGGGSFTLNLGAAAGTLTVEWLNVGDSTVTNGGTLAGGATRTLTPPFTGDAVAYVYHVTGPLDEESPSAPASASATSAGSSTINVQWSAASDNVGVTAYRVERSTGAGSTAFALLATVGGTAWVDTGLAAGTTYNYRVLAVDAAGNTSGYSPVASAATSTATNIQLLNVRTASNNTAGTFVDLAYTVPTATGNDLTLVIQGGARANSTNFALPASATFNGRALTLAGAIRSTGTGTNVGTGIFWLPVSPGEAGTIRLTFTGSCTERAVGAVTLSGADTSGPSAVESVTGSVSVSDTIATTGSNAVILSAAAQGNTGELNPTGTGHVRDFSQLLNASRVAGGHVDVAIPATRTAGFTGNSNRVVQVLAAFRSGGPAVPPVTVPAVLGQSQTDAEAALVNAGLVAGTVTTASSATYVAGLVAAQTPAGGASVPPGSAVNLVISTGARVPNVVNLTEAAATTALTTAGLVVGAVARANHATVPAGAVISQSLVAGTDVPPGTVVDLLVSTGPVLVPVPAVLGLTSGDAQDAILGAQLTVGSITTAPSDTVDAGLVLNQTPAGGTQAPLGSAVALVISSGPAPNAPPTVSLTQPANNATFTAPANIALAATANDTDGTVANVEFFQGGAKLGEDDTAPYAFTWSGVTSGTYSLSARAVDDEGADANSAPVTVVVNNPPVGVHRWLEAECGIVGATWNRLSDANASGGTYVQIANGNNRTFSPLNNARGWVTFVLEVGETGPYQIWGRVIAPTTSDDSFWVRVNGGTWITWNVARGSAWTWDRVRNAANNQIMTYNLEAGDHVIDIAYREDGARLDKLYVTNTATVPTGPGEAATNCAPVPGENVWLEAECGLVGSTWNRLTDPNASGGSYVQIANGNNSTGSVPASVNGRITWLFDIGEAGAYQIWARVIAPTTNDDSFWVRVDDRPWVNWNNVQPSTSWTWDQVHDSNNGSQILLYLLDAGAHVIEIAYRDDGTRLDKLLITNTSTVPSGVGGAAENCE